MPDIFKLHLMGVFRVPFQTRTPDAAGEATQSLAFRDAGFVSMHTQIEDPDNDTAVLVRASKFGCVSHMHADQGSFAVISRGKGLISPSGYFGRGAGTDHHLKWTHQTMAHNCVLVDGVGQRARKFDTRGQIVTLEEAGTYAYTRLNLEEAYPELTACERTIVLIRPGVIVVYDHLEAEQPVQYAWLAHTLSAPQADGMHVRVERDPAVLEMEVFTQGTLDLDWTDRFGIDLNEGVPAHLHRYQPDQYHLTWTAERACFRRFAAVMAVNGAEVETGATEGILQVKYLGVEMKIALDPDLDTGICLDGRPI